jgi:SAM-dependent methyltransferase
VATRYDESAAEMFEPAVVAPAADFLADLAGRGAALELGIGTGRIALPLAQRGIRVYGIDLSEAMVARLRAKPGGEQIGVTIGDFATTKVEDRFSLAYLVFNTIMNLTTQEEQVACHSIPFRYVWPSELDLMARLAGMTLRERWSGWKRAPFTSDSTKHVSVGEEPMIFSAAPRLKGTDE